MRTWCAIALAAWLSGVWVRGAAKDENAFRDPAPPEVFNPEPIPAPEPQNFPALTYHTSPRPLSPEAATQDWPWFLGPTRDMVSAETRLLQEFSEDEPQLVWEMEKGTGYSAPAIAGDRLVFFHRLGAEEIAECLDPATGRRYWSFSYPTTFSDRYGYNNGPRSSPAIDDDRVYLYGAQGKLHCLRLATGQVLWKRDLAEEFGVPQDFFGTATSPLLEEDRLIINVGAPSGPTVIALDKLSGNLLWGAGEQWGPSYATPTPATVHGERRVFVFAGGESRPPTGGLLSIDPADGVVDFAFPWRSRSYESVNAATPVVFGNKVFLSATYRTGGTLLSVDSDFSYEQLWKNSDIDLHWTTAIEHEGHLYAFAGRNEPDAALVCVNATSGKTVWEKVFEWEEEIVANGRRRTIYQSPFRGFLLQADGRFLALGEHGHLLWLQLSPQGAEILSRARLFLARETWTPPVLSRGLLYVAQNGRSMAGDPPRLLCYDLRASARR